MVRFPLCFFKLYFCMLIALAKSRNVRDPITSQLSWVAAWLLVTRVCVYQVEERCYIGVVYLFLGGLFLFEKNSWC